MAYTPPKYFHRFLRWFCREDYLEEIEGDLLELFEKRAEKSKSRANRQFAWDVIKTLRPINMKSFHITNWTMNALRNYTKVYFRRFRKENIHYLVNTLGLALGFTVFFFILSYVRSENKIDTFHTKSDRIFRVLERSETEDGIDHYSSVANPMAGALKTEFPEIEEVANMVYFGSSTFTYGENPIADRSYAITSSSIFNIWDFEVLAGDPFGEFEGDVALVITDAFAKRLFGDENPIGKVVETRFEKAEVIAVVKEFPKNSTWQFQAYFVSDFQWGERWQQFFNNWDTHFMTVWVLFKEGADPKNVLTQKNGFLEKYVEKEIRSEHDFYFQNIEDIHLASSHITDMGMEPLKALPYSKAQIVLILFIIGAFVLIIAALNYINLSSVQALKRTQEAGIRKVNGATVGQLRLQLFVEGFLTLFIAYVLSIILLFTFFPYFIEISGKKLHFLEMFGGEMIGYHAIVFVTIWILSGIIPALYYSRLNKSLLISRSAFVGRGELLRKSFVVVQYGISMVLIIGSIVFYRQLSFIQHKDLGFDKEQLITLDINSSAARKHFKEIVNGLKANPNIVNASASSRVPGEWKDIPTAGLLLDQNKEPLEVLHFAVDQFWMDTYEMKLAAGRGFSGNDASDSLKIILNEKAIELLGLEKPIGQSIWVKEDTISRMQIIGVVKNFHFESLHENLRPVIITSWNNPIRAIDYFTIRYHQNTQDVLTHIEKVQAEFDPGTPPELHFLNEQWERYYQADEARSNLILIATIISIIISTFGLFGLVNFTAERKTKEIGIRKVLGASIQSIFRLVLKDYLVLVTIALVLSGPIAWWSLSSWLEDFAYRVNLSFEIFLIAFGLVLIISLLTVITRVYRLARQNPVNSLRYE